jgi:hypothetical protein
MPQPTSTVPINAPGGRAPQAPGKIILLPPSVLALLRSYVDPDAGEGGDLEQPLTPDAYFWQPIVLGAILTGSNNAGTVVGQGNDSFTTLDTHVGLIFDVRAHIRPIQLSSDIGIAYGGGTTLTPEQMRYIRAMNCKVTLVNTERDEYLIGEGGQNSAQNILLDFDVFQGGSPLKADDLGAFAIVPPKNTVAMQVSLQDTTMENGKGAEYGLLINMIQLRRKRG